MPTVWTIGHSNRELNDFLALLAAEKIESLADVRRFPGSRRHPHFNREALSATLRDVGITYTHFPTLGGRRTAPTETTKNSPWQVPAFAAYADYMLTEDFKAAFHELQTHAAHSRTAIMCAEALPWRCHRRLIADVLTSLGYEVRHIRDASEAEVHRLAPPAAIVDGVLTYASPPDQQVELGLE